MEEFVVDAENAAVFVDGRSYFVALLARVIGRDQVLAPVLDPFDRLAEFERGRAHQHVLRIHFAADAEAAADMALKQLNALGFPPEHQRQAVSVPVRHLGGAVHFQHAIVLARDGAACFQRHAAVPADRKIEFDDGVRGAEGRVHVAGFLFDDGGLGGAFLVERAGRRCGIENDRQRLDIERDQIGGVLGDVWIGGEHRRHRLADIAHDSLAPVRYCR